MKTIQSWAQVPAFDDESAEAVWWLEHGPAPLDALADQMVARLRQTADALAQPPARRAG